MFLTTVGYTKTKLWYSLFYNYKSNLLTKFLPETFSINLIYYITNI